MCQILKKVYDVDPNNSEAVKEVLTAFFQQVPKHKDVERNTWLRALETVICRFPKYCASHRNNIEVYLGNYLDTHDYFQVIGAAKCTHALQQVRLSQDRTATAKSCWRSQINSLCKAAHVLIDDVFENAVDMYKGVAKSNSATSSSHFSSTLENITKVPNNVNRKTLLLLRLRNILIFIQAMLVEVYPVAKAIEPQIILDLVLRSQSVTSGSKINQELCRIKVEALRTLDALVVCLGSNLIPFSPLVLRFVMQTLRWSSDNPGEEASAVRCGAYRSCGGWLAALRTHRADAWAEQLCAHILQDLTPHKKSVQLTIGTQPIRHMSKKARRKQANAMLRESSIAAHMPGEKNKIQTGETVSNEVAMAALSCAEMFLTVCGRFLKPTIHKSFQERLVRECFDTETYDDEHLLALLRVLEASRKTTPPGVAPPTQYCLHLYSVLLNRQADEISKFCSQALLDIRLHLHFSPPSLSFNLEVATTDQHASTKRKKVSEKNRAALENLLGKDRVSQLDDELIVPNEPSPKKPRMDIDTENISVSSNSISSVEISDDSDDGVEEVTVVDELDEPINEDNSGKAIVEQVESKECTPEESQITENENDDSIQNDVSLLPEEKTDPTPEKEINTPVQKDISPSPQKDISPLPQKEINTIHEATTQAAFNISNETFDGDERPLSMEVSYDYPNTGSEKVTILEKEDGDNLPSTNETDDIQITCGQLMKSSQEMLSDKVSSSVDDIGPKINGIKIEVVIENGRDIEINEDQSNLCNGVESMEPHKVNKDEGISVDEMMADFVDEVNEEAT